MDSIIFKSNTNPDVKYRCVKNGWTCNCPSFTHRGWCRHVRIANLNKGLQPEQDIPKIDFDEKEPWELEYDKEVAELKASGKWPPPTNDPWWVTF